MARQLRLRNLAGLVVIDFIDMDEPANNHAVERRMKEALKKDRSRVQVGKMSCFGLLELSRQRMHSSFFESNYTTCPYCGGKGLVRTTDSAAVLILRGIEEEGIRNRSASVNVFVPGDIAVYLLNHKREKLIDLEKRYGMSIIICADNSIKNVSDYRIERVKSTKSEEEDKSRRKKKNVRTTVMNGAKTKEIHAEKNKKKNRKNFLTTMTLPKLRPKKLFRLKKTTEKTTTAAETVVTATAEDGATETAIVTAKTGHRAIPAASRHRLLKKNKKPSSCITAAAILHL